MQVMTRQRIRRGVFRSIVDLQAAIHFREEALDRVEPGCRGRGAVYARPLVCTQIPFCTINLSSSMIAALSVSIVCAVVSTSESSVPGAPALLRYLLATGRGIVDALPAPSTAILSSSSCSIAPCASARAYGGERRKDTPKFFLVLVLPFRCIVQL